MRGLVIETTILSGSAIARTSGSGPCEWPRAHHHRSCWLRVAWSAASNVQNRTESPRTWKGWSRQHMSRAVKDL